MSQSSADRMTDMDGQDGPHMDEVHKNGCYVALTTGYLDVKRIMDKVRSPEAGAIVLFAGTTRDNFDGKPVKELQYSSYNKLALRTMMEIAKATSAKHALKGFAMVHRLGVVPIGEESILIAVSAPHREAAWRAGEEALEDCKARVEVWKREEFEGEEGVWRANRDGARGQKVSESSDTSEQLRPMGPVLTPKHLGEKGHGLVVNPRPHLREGARE